MTMLAVQCPQLIKALLSQFIL